MNSAQNRPYLISSGVLGISDVLFNVGLYSHSLFVHVILDSSMFIQPFHSSFVF